MYGQYEDTQGRLGNCEPLPKDENEFSQSLQQMHFPMHVRAHRAGLVFRLNETDPNHARLKDDSGRYLDSVADMALMRLLFQLAGPKHIFYNDEILYLYNVQNPHSNHVDLDSKRQQFQDSQIVSGKGWLAPVRDYRQANPNSVRATDTGSKTRILAICLAGATPLLPIVAGIVDGGSSSLPIFDIFLSLQVYFCG